jgi:hypothetical protein
MSAVPEGYKLRRSVDRRILESEAYAHWTVADLIEILAEYPQDAHVWGTVTPSRLYPVELVYAMGGHVILG